MEYNNSLKQKAQNILDVSYKLYSDVSLISSSLFRAASAMGAELPEVPQINLAIPSEEHKKVLEKPEKFSQNTKNPVISESSMGMGKVTPKTSKIIRMFSNTKTKELKGSPKVELVDEETEKNAKAIKTFSNEKKEVPASDLNMREQALNKIAENAPKQQIQLEKGALLGEKMLTASSLSQKSTKISLDEQEKKLNSLQLHSPTKVQLVSESKDTSNTPLNLQSSFKKAENEDEDVMVNNPINRLLLLVKEKHSVTTSQAAQALNVSKELIDSWAKILNQGSLIRIKYQLMGDTILEG